MTTSAYALYEFSGEAGDLAFERGSVLTIQSIGDDEWCTGHLKCAEDGPSENLVTGSFPSTYVCMALPEPYAARASHAYEASYPGDISLHSAELCSVLSETKGSWVCVRSTTGVGLAPAAYIVKSEVVGKADASTTPRTPVAKQVAAVSKEDVSQEADKNVETGTPAVERKAAPRVAGSPKAGPGSSVSPVPGRSIDSAKPVPRTNSVADVRAPRGTPSRRPRSHRDLGRTHSPGRSPRAARDHHSGTWPTPEERAVPPPSPSSRNMSPERVPKPKASSEHANTAHSNRSISAGRLRLIRQQLGNAPQPEAHVAPQRDMMSDRSAASWCERFFNALGPHIKGSMGEYLPQGSQWLRKSAMVKLSLSFGESEAEAEARWCSVQTACGIEDDIITKQQYMEFWMNETKSKQADGDYDAQYLYYLRSMMVNVRAPRSSSTLRTRSIETALEKDTMVAPLVTSPGVKSRPVSPRRLRFEAARKAKEELANRKHARQELERRRAAAPETMVKSRPKRSSPGRARTSKPKDTPRTPSEPSRHVPVLNRASSLEKKENTDLITRLAALEKALQDEKDARIKAEAKLSQQMAELNDEEDELPPPLCSPATQAVVPKPADTLEKPVLSDTDMACLDELFLIHDMDGDEHLNHTEFREFLKNIKAWGTTSYNEESWAMRWSAECKLLGASEAGITRQAMVLFYALSRGMECIATDHKVAVDMLMNSEYAEQQSSKKDPARTRSEMYFVAAMTDLGTPGREGAGGKLPASGDTYKAVHKAMLRVGASMESDECGCLEPGTEVQIVDSCDVDGRVRVKCSEGWTSLVTSKGVAVLREVEGGTSTVAGHEVPAIPSAGKFVNVTLQRSDSIGFGVDVRDDGVIENQFDEADGTQGPSQAAGLATEQRIAAVNGVLADADITIKSLLENAGDRVELTVLTELHPPPTEAHSATANIRPHASLTRRPRQLGGFKLGLLWGPTTRI